MSRVLITILISFAFLGEAEAQRSGPQHWEMSEAMSSVAYLMKYDSLGQLSPFGSGVILDFDTSKTFVLLVTNRHLCVGRDSLAVQLNAYQQRDSLQILISNVVNVKLHQGTVIFPASPDSDFAVIKLQRPRSETTFFRPTSENTIDLSQLRYGDEVLFLGFPAYGLYGLDAARFRFPIARAGSIAFFAQEDIYFAQNKKYMIPGMFLIDGESFGGNSGGPVFVRRPVLHREGKDSTLVIREELRLAGIIQGHLPMLQSVNIPKSRLKLVSEIAESASSSEDSILVSKLLHDLQLTWEENSGLAIAISIRNLFSYRNHSCIGSFRAASLNYIFDCKLDAFSFF